MFELEVLPPRKTETRYEFECVLRAEPRTAREALGAARWLVASGRFRRTWRLRFGFEALNFAIPHHPCWDSVYPLMYLTRNGGPLFGRDRDEARLVFRYPILAAVRDFYVRRAGDLGLRIEVDAPLYDARADLPTRGHVLAFGGGKDSRMLLGALRELGWSPVVVTAGVDNVPDLPDALVTRSFSGVLADRVMPALMGCGRQFYFGSTLANAHRHSPWHRSYDWGSPRALAELSALLVSLGIEMHAHAPAAVLPSNLVQRILYDRYPELYRHQNSVPKEDRSEKNLHVALCKLRHGIAFEDHCGDSLFAGLARDFVEQQTAHPRDFDYRNCREVVRREMRAILFAGRAHPRLASLSGRIPADWHGPWIDYLHGYVDPQVDRGFLEIFRAYAPSVDESPSPDGIWRIPL